MHAQGFSVGLGYRKALHDALFEEEAAHLDFVELAPENYHGLGGRWRRRLDLVRARWPIITHGLALSLGGHDPLDAELVDAVAEFTEEIGTPWHSDHLSFSMVDGNHLHDLLPIPFTSESARRVAERIKSVQRALSVPFAIENVSAYARRSEDTLEEAEFITEVVELAGCRMLLDVNNIYVNAVNFHLDPYELLRRMPAEAAIQIHVAGFFRESDDLLIDSHGSRVADPVWPLLEEALRRTGPIPVLLERDNNFPPLAELLLEIDVIRDIGVRVFGGASRNVRDGVRV